VTCLIRNGFRTHQFIVRLIAVIDTIATWGIAARPARKRRLGAKATRLRDDPRFHQINGLATACGLNDRVAIHVQFNEFQYS
jgi:hypothetical protein